MVRVRSGECGWIDPDNEPPPDGPLSEEELEVRLAEACTLSSGIPTLITVADTVRGEA